MCVCHCGVPRWWWWWWWGWWGRTWATQRRYFILSYGQLKYYKDKPEDGDRAREQVCQGTKGRRGSEEVQQHQHRGEEEEEEFFNHYKNDLKRHAHTPSGDIYCIYIYCIYIVAPRRLCSGVLEKSRADSCARGFTVLRGSACVLRHFFRNGTQVGYS